MSTTKTRLPVTVSLVKGPMHLALRAQRMAGRLEPGQEGWWEVWGARWADVQAGDLLLVATRRDDVITHHEHLVGEVLPPEDGIRGAIWFRFTDGETGEIMAYGRLCPVGIVRRGTHHTLSPHCR